MRRLILSLLVFLVLSLLGSALLAQRSVDFCPVDPDEELIEAPTFKGETVPSIKAYTVPRKQVLLEIAMRPT